MEADLSWIVIAVMTLVLLAKLAGGCCGGGTCG
jgi:hypothetical protein